MITEFDKKRVIEHILYTMYQMFKAGLFISEIAPRIQGSMTEQARQDFYLESFLMNLRSLVHFFSKSASHKDNRDPRSSKDCDVYATDYGFPATTFTFNQPTLSRINRQVAHLTYHRIPLNQDLERDFYPRDSTHELMPVCKKFIIHLLKNYPTILCPSETIDGKTIEYKYTQLYLNQVGIYLGIDEEYPQIAANMLPQPNTYLVPPFESFQRLYDNVKDPSST